MMSAARQQALAYFTGRGWSLAQSAGIVANLESESGLRPDAVGDGSLAYGAGQWHPDRQAAFAKVFGKPIQGSSLAEQLAFVDWELRNTEKSAGAALANCMTPEDAGATISRLYERPADREGEAARRAALARQISAESTAAQPAAPIEDKSTTLPKETSTMGAALTLLPLLAQYIPQIMTLIKPGSASTQKDAALAQTILNVATTAAGTLQAGQQASAAQVGAAVDAMAADPALAKKVQQAVVTHPDVLAVLEIGAGGISAARAANQAAAVAEKPFWYNPAFAVTVMLLPMVYWIVGSVLIGGIEIPDDGAWYIQLFRLFGTQFNAETRSGTVNLVIGMVLGGIVGIWFGTSYGSMRKTELAANATAQAAEDR